MPTPPLSKELMLEAVQAFREHGSKRGAAMALGIDRCTFKHRYNRAMEAAKRGDFGFNPVIPTFEVQQASVQLDQDGNVKNEWIKQAPERSEFQIPDGHVVKGVSALTDASGNVIQQWYKTREGEIDQVEAVRIAIEECKQDLPPIQPVPGPSRVNSLLLNQYTVTDLHFGMLAWGEETGDSDYNLKIAENLLLDWFSAAIAISPNAETAVLAQLGDLLHYDSMESVTPTSKHVLDADSRIPKMIRTVVRVIRQIITMLLQAHQNVHVIMARANHDPVSEAWLRELLAVLFEGEPRITVDTSADTYYAYEWGRTALFYHHGHKRGMRGVNVSKAVDAVFAGKFRDIFGGAKQSYGHIGHLHSDEVIETPLMRLERHRTLAPMDAHTAEGGWLSGRDAKVITYHKEFGEVHRTTLSPQMVMGARKEAA